jgi:hypothetical protein
MAWDGRQRLDCLEVSMSGFCGFSGMAKRLTVWTAFVSLNGS